MLAETPEEWIRLGGRVHGGFGSYIALGIRIGLDAMKRLDTQQRVLKVIPIQYQIESLSTRSLESRPKRTSAL